MVGKTVSVSKMTISMTIVSETAASVASGRESVSVTVVSIGVGISVSGSLADKMSVSAASVASGRESVSTDSWPGGVGVVGGKAVAVVPVVGISVGFSFGISQGGESGDYQKLEHFAV